MRKNISSGTKWSEEHKQLLVNTYYNFPKEELLELFTGRSWDAIKLKANKLGLKRNSDMLSETNPKVLLEDTCESYYWIGFLLADGSFKDDKRLVFSLATKDCEQVQRFASFIGLQSIHKYSIQCSVSIKHSSIKDLMLKFGVNEKKTYNPPPPFLAGGDLLISLFIGLIDGDGCIKRLHNRKDSFIKIKCHSSWIEFYTDLSARISNILDGKICPPHINNTGYMELCISDTKTLRALFLKCNELHLPVLERKWSNIDPDYISKIEVSDKRISEARRLFSLGKSKKETAEILGMSSAGLSKIIKRNNISTYVGRRRA